MQKAWLLLWCSSLVAGDIAHLQRSAAGPTLLDFDAMRLKIE
jgi:hypothetical protein